MATSAGSRERAAARPSRRAAATFLGLILVLTVVSIGVGANVGAALAATADAGPDRTVALGLPVTLDASASVAGPGATYSWQFGDGSIETTSQATLQHNYRFAGGYVATVTVTDGGGSSTDTAAATVEMKATNLDYSRFPPDRDDYLTPGLLTRYVAPGGSDADDGSIDHPYRTIQYAVTQAESGTAVLVRGGHYFTGDIVIDKSNLALAAYPGEKVVLETDRYDVWEHRDGLILEGPVSGVVVDGLRIRRFTTTGVRFGDPETQRGIVLKNLVIDGAESGIGTAYSSTPPTKPFIDGLLVKNCQVQHSAGMGFNAGQSADPANPIALYRNVRLDRVYALLNGAGNDTGMDAFALENGENVLAENSIAQGPSGDGFDFKADHVAVVDSIARHITRNGIKLWHNGEIVNSLVYDTGADAGVVLEEGRFRMVNSVAAWHLKGQAGGAYSMTAGYANPAFQGLDIFRSILYQECDRFHVNDTGSLSVRENIFWGFGLNRILEYGGTDYETVGAINGAAFGGGNEEQDPGFVDPENDDWRIPAGSNGFVYPDLVPRPVVTVIEPAYPYPAGPLRAVRWRSDQSGAFSVEAATNAVPGSGALLRSGPVAKDVVMTTTAPASSVPAGTPRLYVFVGNSRDETGWEAVRWDDGRPLTYAPRAASAVRGRITRLYYRVVDEGSASVYAKLLIRDARGRAVRLLALGWKGVGITRYHNFRAVLPRGRYTLWVYATDRAGNRQRNVAHNTLSVR